MHRFKTIFNKFLCLYIILWFGCGVIYWISANYTMGKCFVFEEDLLLQIKTDKFQKLAGTNMNSEPIKKLFVDTHENLKSMVMRDTEGEVYTFRFSGIGEVWADYYESKLLHERYDYFSFDIKKEEELLGATDYAKVELNFYNIKPHYEDCITKNQILFYSSEDDDVFEHRSKASLWLKKQDYIRVKYHIESMSIGPREVKYIPILLCKDFLVKSVNYLDDSYKIFNNIQNESFTYSFIDFLYFSAVTITTLGYGDISPNSTLIRGIVMMETLLGVILIGLYVSDIFSKKVNK